MTLHELPGHLHAAPPNVQATPGDVPIFVVYASGSKLGAVLEALELLRKNAMNDRTVEIRNWLKCEADRMRPHSPATASIFDEIRTMLDNEMQTHEPGRVFAI